MQVRFRPIRGLLAADGLGGIDSEVRLESPGGILSAGDAAVTCKHLKGIVRSRSVRIAGRSVNVPPLIDAVDLKLHLGHSNFADVVVDGTLVLDNLSVFAITRPVITTLGITEGDSREMRHLVRS